jgi:general secretion pathway protein D
MNAFTPSFAFTVVNKAIEAKVKLLQQDGKIKTLATPTLLVANNEVARIFAGKEYPLVSGWRPAETVVSESGIVQGTMTVEITKEDVGTMLLITPNINADKTVTLRLLQENSAVSPEKVDIPVDGGNGETRQIEYVESRSLAGTFVAKDGMTLLAGGLVKETEGQTYWRTPVLGSIPLVGWLFRGTEKVRERTELIVLIRPHVISTPVEGGKISRELLKALSAHPAADGRASMGVLKRDVEHDVGDDVKNMAGQGR